MAEALLDRVDAASRARVRDVTPGNGGTPFGIAAVDLGLFSEPGVLDGLIRATDRFAG